MDRLSAIQAFVGVAEHHSFRGAAARLGRSASVVTRQVSALESHLGVQLLARTTRSVALTDAGARYLERVRQLLTTLAEADAAAQDVSARPRGRLTVAAPTVFGRLHVAPLLADFLAKHDAVQGVLTLADRLQPLGEGGIDVAVRIGDLDDSSLRARPVGAVRRVLVASRSYLRKHGRPKHPTQLTSHAIVSFSSLTPTREWQFGAAGSRLSIPIHPRFVTDSADAAVDAAVRGLGIARVLSYQAAQQVRTGALRIVLPDHEPAPVPVQLVWMPSAFLPAASRAFIDHVVARAAWNFVEL